MISDLFIYSKIIGTKYETMYQKEFIIFYLNISLLEKEKFSIKELEAVLRELYRIGSIRERRLLSFLIEHFEICEEDVKSKLTIEERELYKRTKQYGEKLEVINEINKEELYNIIEKEIQSNSISFTEKLENFITYYFGKEKLNKETKLLLQYNYFKIISEHYKIYKKIENMLEKIPSEFNNIEVTEMNFKEEATKMLIENNIFTIKNIKETQIDELICIGSIEIEGFIQIIENYATTKEQIIEELKEEFEKSIKPEWAYIIEKRVKIEDEENTATLEELGNELNISKQRVLDILKDAVFKLKTKARKIRGKLYCIYKLMEKEEHNFITTEELLEFIEDKQLTKYLTIIFTESVGTTIILNQEYGILYNEKETDIKNIVEEHRNNLEDIIPIKEKTQYNKVEKQILENEYKIYQEKIYIKKNMNISEMYMNEIKESFAEGYDIGSDSQYEELKQILQEKYGNIDVPNKRAIKGMIERYDFILIDRGRYKEKQYCAKISERLLEEIISYIIKNSPIVAYNSIFEQFKEKLLNEGISNRYYLKGVIDEKLPSEFSLGRDYINTNSEENATTYNVMKDIFKTFEAEFTIEDLKEKMPGLKTYNYENYAKQEEANGLIRYSTKTYIYFDKLNITEETKKELKIFIDNLFEKMNEKVLTAKKIYAKLNILNKELFDKLHITSNLGDFELFSIIQYLYENEYYYRRPLISIERNFTNSTDLLIKEYISTLEQFSNADVKKYRSRMNLGQIYSYQKLMEELSDEYVQINIDTMVKKEKFEITEEQLEKIKEFLNLVLRKEELRTDKFEGYLILPRLERRWNKYMLVGIIRTYFKEEYEIENTTNFYDSTEYIIRRRK